MVGGLVAIFVIIVIGAFLYFEIGYNIPTGSTTGATIMTQLNSTAATVFSLAPIVGIVAIASIMIGIITRFGGGGGGGV